MSWSFKSVFQKALAVG